MGSTVAVGGLEISSNTESAEQMVQVLKPKKEDSPGPKVVEDKGKAVEVKEEEKSDLSKAAAELGKKGGEAAAKAREAKKDEPPEEKPEAEAKGEDEKPKDEKAEGEEKDDKPGHRRHDPRAAVMEARRAQREAEARAKDLEERFSRLEAKLRESEPKPEKEAAPAGRDDSKKPTPDQFETYEEFIEAMTDWKAERILEREVARAAEKQRVSAVVEKIDRTVQGFKQRMKEAQAADPEVLDRVDPYFLKLTPASQLPPGEGVGPDNIVAQEIMESEHGPKLMVYLSEHPEEMKRLLEMDSPQAIVRAVGRLEVKLADMPMVAAPKGTSRAPSPVRPVATTPNAEIDYTGEMDFDTFYRRAQGRRR